ncbi:MAG: thiamine pyrophosphate-dependent dehydrogenase E1 component subunit alpha [Chloroflexota bacterium]|nr:thiamine pyrophosphate-dependent dehydrogenase E1 component subunit alpha [Chloroflexota bacterium]
MQMDLWELCKQMLRSRIFEEAVIQLWEDGFIFGEMHVGIGEEAIAAGVVAQLRDGDAMALDHRPTPSLLMRGIDPVLLLREFLGCPDGLCCGIGGHMHLFSQEHLAASSGIVGASGPTAVGFALAAQHLRPGTVAVAFFGDGAINQGMLMEALNLAAIWKLPVLFVCKDNEWAITTLSQSVTAGNIVDRVRAFGIRVAEVNGSDVEAVWKAANEAIDRARKGEGPSFLQAHCCRPEGHLLGDPMVQMAHHPISEMKKTTVPLLKSITKREGGSLAERARSMGMVASLIGKTAKDRFWKQDDPLELVRNKLKFDHARLKLMEEEANREIQQVVQAALMTDELGTGGRQ